MKRTSALWVLLVPAALSAAGCHTMRFEVGDGQVGNVVYERKSFFLGGLVPTQRVDVTQHCPAGAVAVSEEMTFVDGLIGFFTLSIYTPRSSTFHCDVEGAR